MKSTQNFYGYFRSFRLTIKTQVFQKRGKKPFRLRGSQTAFSRSDRFFSVGEFRVIDPKIVSNPA